MMDRLALDEQRVEAMAKASKKFARWPIRSVWSSPHGRDRMAYASSGCACRSG
jgi:hypothetical protein